MANLSSNANQPAAAQGLWQCNADTGLSVTAFKKSSECYGQLLALLLLLLLKPHAETPFFSLFPKQPHNGIQPTRSLQEILSCTQLWE